MHLSIDGQELNSFVTCQKNVDLEKVLFLNLMNRRISMILTNLPIPITNLPIPITNSPRLRNNWHMVRVNKTEVSRNLVTYPFLSCHTKFPIVKTNGCLLRYTLSIFIICNTLVKPFIFNWNVIDHKVWTKILVSHRHGHFMVGILLHWFAVFIPGNL